MTKLIVASLDIVKAPNKIRSYIFAVINTSKLRATEARVVPLNAYSYSCIGLNFFIGNQN